MLVFKFGSHKDHKENSAETLKKKIFCTLCGFSSRTLREMFSLKPL
jgi:hypothetical protein